MNPAQIERVFGRGRLKMTTGEHVEVFREAVAPGERRRYTKRFLATSDGDFGQWTEREWRILARLIGHGVRCVPDVVQFDGGAMGGIRLVQTYDAGITADQWATLLPVSRDGAARRHVFEDCAHWWALAHYCLTALDEIHSLELVHLDIKGDNICIPYGPTNFDPDAAGRFYPIFPKLALIDFAFSLVSRENLSTPLPIGWQKDYDYQSPRLLKALDAGRNGDLQPTKELDWRCDMYSLAAMLRRYLPSEAPDDDTAWTRRRYDDARTLIFRLRECHDGDPYWRPHQQLIEFTGARVTESDLVASLEHGWTLARDLRTDSAASPATPLTRITMRAVQPLRTVEPLRTLEPLHTIEPLRTLDPLHITTRMVAPTAVTAVRGIPRARAPRRTLWRATVLAPAVGAIAAFATPAFIGTPGFDLMRSMFERGPSDQVVAQSGVLPALQREEPPAPVADATPAPIEQPAADAAAQEPARDQPGANPTEANRTEANPASAVPEQKIPSTPVAKPRAKSTSANASPRTPSPSLSVSGVTRSGRPLPRSALTANSKQPRGPSIASAGTSRQSNTRPSSVQKQRLQTSPPEVRVAASPPVPTPPGATVIAQAASPSTDDARVGTSDPAPDQNSSKPGVAAQLPVQQALPRTASNEAQTSTALASGASGVVERTPNEQHRGSPQTASQGQQRPQNPQPLGELRTLLSNLGHLLQGREGPPRPIEERRIAAPPPTESLRAEVHPSPLPAPPRATPPTVIADAHAEVAPSRGPAVPAPSLPSVVESAPRALDQSHEALVAHARRVIADEVPRVAAQSQPDVSKVLALAASANHRSQQQAVVDAAYVAWPSENAWFPAGDTEPLRARQLHNEARKALASGRVSDAVDIELAAFGANPRDPDIAVYLAFLHLRTNPVQAEAARRLALYAISVSGSQRPIRYGDWDTLAVASALAGRNSDATRALFVEIALTSNLDRTCQTALSAYAAYGERFRAPVQAMLSRIDSNGRISPYCEWPTKWNTSMR